MIDVVQVGGLKVPLASHLSSDFEYQYVANDHYDDATDKQAPFANQLLKQTYQTAIFLVSAGSALLTDLALVQNLPAYQILYDQNLTLPAAIAALFEQKGAQPVSLRDPAAVAKLINQDYFGSQMGQKLPFDDLTIEPTFLEDVHQMGHNRLTFAASFGQQSRQIASWESFGTLPADWQLTFLPEATVTSGDVEVSFKLYMISYDGRNTIKTVITKTLAELQAPFALPVYDELTLCKVTVWARGAGVIRLGNCHFRRSRHDRGELMAGGQRLVDHQNMGSELFVYFNPGDLKPPLNVYFSGYREAEGFEAIFMMRNLSSPFMVIGDPRISGGAFYMGSQQLEDDLVDAIQERLDQLHFTNDQLILSGLSMGTYGALYYAARLKPHAVVVGKPLVNLGTVAENERIKRPGGFPTSLDILLWHTGRADSLGVDELNLRFWRQFGQGNFENTTFAITYMKEDDYDGEAFQVLFRTLRQRFPNVKVLYKGLTGRHNDDTNGIVKWFLAQYNNLLWTDFKRPRPRLKMPENPTSE